MEQLFDVFGIDGKLLLAQLINFGVLFVGLTWLLYRPVMKTLDERREKIAAGVRAAEEAEEKLAGADKEAASVMKSAETEAESMMARAREEAGSEKGRLMKEAEERAAQIAKDAEARAKETEARARKESEKDIARLAVLAAEKMLKETR